MMFPVYPFRFSLSNDEQNTPRAWRGSLFNFNQGPIPETTQLEPVNRITPVSPFEGAYESMAEPGPAMQSYMEHIRNAPRLQDYKPSKMSRLAAALSGASEGYFKGAGQGFQTAQNVLMSPYEMALRQHEIQGKGLAQAANIEENTMQHRVNMLKAIESSRNEQARLQNQWQNIQDLMATRKITREEAQARMDNLKKQGQLIGLRHRVNEVDGTEELVNDITKEVTPLGGQIKETPEQKETRAKALRKYQSGLDLSRQKNLEKIRFGNQVDMQNLRYGQTLGAINARAEKGAYGRGGAPNVQRNRQATIAKVLSNPGRYVQGESWDTDDNGNLMLKPIDEVPKEHQQAWRELYDTLYSGMATPSTPFVDEDEIDFNLDEDEEIR